MKKAEDLSGRRFGRWTVIERAGTYYWPNKEEREFSCPLWRCVCDCGTEGIVMGTNLRSGNSKSCGCSRMKVAFSADTGMVLRRQQKPEEKQ